MKLEVATVIQAHRGGEDAYHRNQWGFPWPSPNHSVTYVMSPHTQRLNVPVFQELVYGEPQHAGPEATRRFFRCLSTLEAQEAKINVFMEYDSILVGQLPEVGEWDCLGNWFPDSGPGAKRAGFDGLGFMQPPVVFGNKALKAIRHLLGTCSEYLEKGFWDRQLGWLFGRLGPELCVRNFRTMGVGFACNTIDDGHLPGFREWLSICPERKMLAIHGLKGEESCKLARHYWSSQPPCFTTSPSYFSARA